MTEPTRPATPKLSDDFPTNIQWAEIVDFVDQGVFTLDKNDRFNHNSVFREHFALASKSATLKDFATKIKDVFQKPGSDMLVRKLERREHGDVVLHWQEKSDENNHVVLSLKKSSNPDLLIGISRKLEINKTDADTDPQWLLNSMFEAVEEGIFILEPESLTIRRANQAALRIFGMPGESLIDRSVLSLLANPSRSDEISRMIAAKLPILKSVHVDLDMRRSNGTTFPALHGIVEISTAHRQVVAWMWIVTDMTQRVFINRALVDLETRYRLLFDRTADPTLIIDAKSRKIIDANAAAEAQLLYARTELIGLHMEDITPQSRRGGMWSDFSALGIGENGSIEGVNLTKTGVEIPVQISAVATDFEGRKVFIASCRDISQRRQLENERLRIEKLDTVRKIAGGLAHEFSQPLQGLTTIVDLLGHPGLTPLAQAELLHKIEPAVLRMVTLLEQMKNIVRVETKPYTAANDIVDFKQSISKDEKIKK